MLTRRAILHAPLLPFSEPAPALVALGDSLAARPGSYAERLAERRGLVLENRALGGTTLAEQAEAWLRAPLGPTVVIAGYNDMRLVGAGARSLASFRALLLALCMWRTREGHPLYLGTCLRMPRYDYQGSAAGAAAYAEQARGVAAAVPGVTLIDTHAGYAPTLMGADGVHPSPAGTERLADLFDAAMPPRVALPLVR